MALPHHRRQELVLVQYPDDHSDWPASPGDLLHQARRGHIKGERALVLMPPTDEADLDIDIERCESRAEPHQEYFDGIAGSAISAPRQANAASISGGRTSQTMT